MFDLFLKGFLIGFSVAMPVGPIAMLCIKHAVTRGFTYGIASGLGAACADGVYGALAGVGVSAIATVLSVYQVWFQLLGALFLLYLGVTTFFSAPASSQAGALQRGYISIFLTTFLLTLTNPITIFVFAGIFAAIGIETGNLIMPLVLTSGVFLGSMLWWLIVSTGAAFFGRKFQLQSSQSNILNHISGSVLIAFGVIALLASLQYLITH